MSNWIRPGLIKWYLANKRDLPWRNETDPYRIWLSEVILQQTQVAQGLSYYLKFVREFPDIKALAAASEDKVLRLWQGLGYYSRARNLYFTARYISSGLNGKFPSTYEEIRKLKGIGDYTAAAIASFSFALPHAVVDGNVYRVLARLFGIHTPIDTSEGKKEFSLLANRLLDKKEPGRFNQAMMEFGSQMCRPANPDCGNCPFKSRCVAHAKGLTDLLPVKVKMTKVTKRYFNYLVIADKKGCVQVKKRTENDIWKGLYEFNLLESRKELRPAQFLAAKDVKQLLKPGFGLKHVSQSYKHVLTHQHLHARFYVVHAKKEISGGRYATLNELNELAFPRLIGKFLEDHDLKEMLYF